jgi:hypothetical protein
MGGVFSGGDVVSGNQLVYNNQMSRSFTYTPPAGYMGVITLVADSGNTYVSNGELEVTVTLLANSFQMQCLSSGTSGDWATSAFVDPGSPLDCQIILNGAYDGSFSLADLTGETDTSVLGGVFSSSDSRFSGGAFTTTIADTSDTSGQVLSFTYTSPSWTWIMDNLYDGDNGYYLFWPIITATSSGVLTPVQSSVAVGLLAQEYEIYSLDYPPIDQNFGCIGCIARFSVSTFNAPYFGNIVLSSDMDAGFDIGSGDAFTPTIMFSFDGSGSEESFRYRPNLGSEGVHTISGASSGPAIEDGEISFDVNTSHTLLTCNPIFLERGASSECTLDINPLDFDPSSLVWLHDIFISYVLPDLDGDGIFTDTSDITGTFIDGVYAFCDLGTDADCTTETWERSFIYTLPADVDSEYAVVRLQAEYKVSDGVDTNWALLNIIPDDVDFYCSDISPDCEISRVGQVQDYILRPNGLFAGQIKVTAENDDYAEFSDDGLATWNYDASEFDFTYTPGTTGIVTLVAEVTRVDDPNSGINVGDKYYMTVYVMADTITLTGPDTIARDTVPTMPRFVATLNGPFIGTISVRLVRHEGATEIPFINSTLVGLPMVGGAGFSDNGDGTFSCTVTQDMLDSGFVYPGGPPIYDPSTNITTACMADSGGAAGFILDYNWFEVHATVPDDPTIIEAVKMVGLVADDYTVTLDGDDATTDVIVTTFGTPLTFAVTPNALFAGVYTFDDNGALGYFVPPGNITRTQDQWPATNDQNLQSQMFTYVPQDTGYITLTVDAIRETGLATVGNEDLGTKTIELLVLANTATIQGPSTLIRGQTGNYTLQLNGPYIGEFVFSDDLLDLTSPFNITGCQFTLADYNEVTNTTSCNFTFTVAEGSYYTNTAGIFATSSSTSIVATTTVNIIADDFDLVSDAAASDETIIPATPTDAWRMVLENRRLGTPTTFTLIPNAMFDGVFEIAIADGLTALGGYPCPTASEFEAVFSPDQITYQYIDYSGIGQDPLPQTFTITSEGYGHACVLVTATPTDTAAYSSAGVTIEPKMIEIHTFGDPHIGGPDSIVNESLINQFNLIMLGDPTVTVDFWAVDPTTCNNPLDPMDCGAPIDDIVFSGEYITETAPGVGQCTFTSDNWGANTATDPAMCGFNLALPAHPVGNRIRLIGRDSMGNEDYYDVNIIANAFTLTPATVSDAQLDQPITFTITPVGGLFADSFSLSDDSGLGIFDSSTVIFTTADWPLDNTPMAGKTFQYSPEQYGLNIVTAMNDALGSQMAEVWVLADAMGITGTINLQIANTMIGYYTLDIYGPYTDKINLSVYDPVTGTPIVGVDILDTGTGGEYCEPTLADYDAVNNVTSCTFAVVLPSYYMDSKRIAVRAETDASSRYLEPVLAITNITANDFSLTPPGVHIAAVGETLTFTITPNSISNRAYTISTDGASNLNINSLSFTASEWPIDSNDDVSKTFTVTTTTPGTETITVTSSLGVKTVVVHTLANAMSLSGTSAIQIGSTMSGSYRLLIPGPYAGTINFTATDTATSGAIPGTTFSNGGSCTLTTADYGAVVAGATICDFTITLTPANFPSTHYMQVSASTDTSSPSLTLAAPVVTAITANDFTLSPPDGSSQVGTVGTPITFTVTPNSVFAGTFNVSSAGSGSVNISSPTVSFSLADFPTTSNTNVGKTFTVTPTTPGIRTISVANPFGGAAKTVEITTFATELDVTGPTRIQRGTTSGVFTLSINGPYAGTATISVYIPQPGGATNVPALDVTLSRTTCVFTLADYDATTNTTSCTFTAAVPEDVAENYIGITATAPGLEGDPIVAITANDFDLTAESHEGVVGQPITFTVRPNGLFEGILELSDGGEGGIFSPVQLVFNSSDWPAHHDHTLPAGLTFTYTPTHAGEITILVHDINTGIDHLIDHDWLLTIAEAPEVPEVPEPPVDPDAPDTVAWLRGEAGIVRAIVIGGVVAVVAVGAALGFVAFSKRRRFH